MVLKSTDKIRGASRGTPYQAISRINGPDAKDIQFIKSIYKYASEVFIDPAVLVAQAAHETGGFTSSRWNQDLNPAGIGITSDDTKQPFTIPNSDVSAMIYVSMMNRLLKDRKIDEPWLGKMPAAAQSWLASVWANHCKYAPSVTTIDDLNKTYKYPSGDGAATWATDVDYSTGVVRWASIMYPFLNNQSNATKNDVIFGNAPRPNIQNLIVQKQGPGHGYTALSSPRWLVGGCEHITDGLGSVAFYAEFFGISGERESDALVDFVIDKTGAIGMLNDPWGYRSPWANGGLDGLEGPGPAFLAKFGVDGVNDQLWSTEHEGRANDDWTDAQISSTVDLDVFKFDSVGVRWDSYPVHQDYGIQTHLDHSVFTGKGGNTASECAGLWWHQNKQHVYSAVKSGLKKVQTGSGTSDPVVVPDPKDPIPAGLTEAKLAKWFGELKFRRDDAPAQIRKFNIKGQISLTWLSRCIKENVFPHATVGWELHTPHSTLQIVEFVNGWLMVNDSRTPRKGWFWSV